jgi:protein TonB
MKLASSFILSLGLHATALLYAVSLLVPVPAQPIRVTVFSVQPESRGTAGEGAKTGAAGHPGARRPRSFPQQGDQASAAIAASPSAPPHALPAQTTTLEQGQTAVLLSAAAHSADTNSGAVSANLASPDQGSGATSNGAGGLGNGGNGGGGGFGNGHGSGNGAAWSQPRYGDTPKPIYPEGARRAGREGRVLLRVLVDDRGRTKRVEINSSSGDEGLDRAAVEAVKRWRFYPARYGDKAVESWLRVPIEFRLAEAQAW